jgi:hypothetical protein
LLSTSISGATKTWRALFTDFNMPKGGGGMGSTACVKDRARFPAHPFARNEANGIDSDLQMQAK